MCLGEMATQDDENRVRKLFSAIGKVWTAEEKYFDAVTGLRYVAYYVCDTEMVCQHSRVKLIFVFLMLI
jgi:hypothetical protein